MDELTKAAETHVQQQLLEHLPPAYLFHNYEQTAEVAAIAEQLSDQAELSPEQTTDVILAAWFHDMGYIKESNNHQVHGAKFARQFLEENNHPEERIVQIEQMIRSTSLEVEPTDLLQKILHDAKWSFLGRKRFFKKARLLRFELEELEGQKYSSKRWNKFSLDLQVNTKFYTPWGQAQFGVRKYKNVSIQQDNLRKAKVKKTRAKTGKDFGRGIDTIYRITLRNHLNLSSIADGKARMLISINTLVLSILITAGTAGLSLDNITLAANIYLVAPIIVLMLSSLIAIIFAVLSAMPKVSGVPFTEEDLKQHKVSLLFFGNFLQLEKEQFVSHLRELKKDQELLYDELSRDLYNLGAVLKKKYALLTIAYRVFVGGLITAVAVFLIAYLFS